LQEAKAVLAQRVGLLKSKPMIKLSPNKITTEVKSMAQDQTKTETPDPNMQA